MNRLHGQRTYRRSCKGPSNHLRREGGVKESNTVKLLDQFQLMIDQRTQAHDAFLRFSAKLESLAAEQLAMLAQAGTKTFERVVEQTPDSAPVAVDTEQPLQARLRVIPDEPPASLTREQCMEFAIGKIGHVLGKKFAEIDQHPTRVRLPDEPLMLVDRILKIEGEPLSMTSGRVVTEHDIHRGAWYLDCERIPTCIAVESGQADLFLSGWLGIDLQTKGQACYRLLDAVVTFHDALPQAGKTIHYDIRVLHFFRQGNTYLFRFEFDATVDGRPLLTMREGCAGFFTEQELAGGKGIIHTALDKRPRPGIRPADWSDPVLMSVERYDDRKLLALRQGDLATCFGPAFAGLPLAVPVTLPGLKNPSESESTHSRMWLIDRVLKLDPVGGKFGMGTILGELDIHPDDWFLTCHFCDDQVMPGTLMYECCLHTLRIYLLRMGWIGEAGQIAYEPIPGIRSRLKCRGQVLASTRKVWYEVTLKEIGYGKDVASQENAVAPHTSSPLTLHSAYCLADALMYADGKPIVEITDMSVRLTGLTREIVEQLWAEDGHSCPSSSRGLPREDDEHLRRRKISSHRNRRPNTTAAQQSSARTELPHLPLASLPKRLAIATASSTKNERSHVCRVRRFSSWTGSFPSRNAHRGFCRPGEKSSRSTMSPSMPGTSPRIANPRCRSLFSWKPHCNHVAGWRPTWDRR